MREPQLKDFGLDKIAKPTPEQFFITNEIISNYKKELKLKREHAEKVCNSIERLTIILIFALFIYLFILIGPSYIYLVILILLIVTKPLGHLFEKIESSILSKAGTDLDYYLNVNGYKQACADYEIEYGDKYRQYEDARREYLNDLRIQEYNREAARRQHLKNLKMREYSYWFSLDGLTFEKEMAEIYRKLGYKVTLTPASNDKGVDLILLKDNRKAVAQCKAHKNPVGPHIVRDLYGALIDFKADKAILIALSGFTKGVYDFARGKPIQLLGIDDVISMHNKTMAQ